MNCPSCNLPYDSRQIFCVRCGFALARRGHLITAMRHTLTWVLRRSLAGLVTGLMGWLVVAAAGRAAGSGLMQWGHLMLTGAIGGFFLGTVEGMVEESSHKTLRSGCFGLLGGLLGGALSDILIRSSGSGMTAVVVAWAVTGAAVGTASVWMERQPLRIMIGATAGFIGGALGGWLGYQMYASLLDMLKPDAWWLKRLIEGTTGAVLGALLWFVIGLAEKLWIFKRRIASNISYKECDRCQHANILKAWYCASCGALLQVSAPPEKLHLPKRQALVRVLAASRFLGELFGISSAAISVLVAVFLGMINFFLGLFGLLATVLIGYLLYTFFHAVADLLSPQLDSPNASSSAHPRPIP